MSAGPGALPVWRWDRTLLLALSLFAGSLVLALPQLITPYPHQAPWYESAALFPRLALCLAAAGGLFEVYLRRRVVEQRESDELDSSGANIRQVVGVLVLWVVYMLAVPVAGYLTASLLFIGACGAWLQLGWRTTALLAVPLSVVMWAVFVLVLKVSFGHGWWV